MLLEDAVQFIVTFFIVNYFSPELNESWTNKDGDFLMLGSDIALLSNLTDLESCNPDPYRPECPKEPTRDLVSLMSIYSSIVL